MKKLSYLLRDAEYQELVGPADPLISDVQFQYKKVGQDDVYFALIYPGREGDDFSNGHDYIDQVIQQGARVIVCETLPETLQPTVTYLKVGHVFEVMAVMIANYYDNPAKQLKLVGATGTNGKTSVMSLLHQLYTKLGYRAGLISTVVDKIGEEEIPTDGTTPNAKELNQLWRKMADAGCEYCFMEVTSHAIFQKRVSMVDFAASIFTSISADHIGYHGSFEEYVRVKKAFFDVAPASSVIIYNSDDAYGARMIEDAVAPTKAVGRDDESAPYAFKVLSNSLQGLELEVAGKPLSTDLGAIFNAYNLVTTYATAVELGEDKERVWELLPQLGDVDGRFNIVKSPDGKIGVIDFAHNLGALEKLYDLLEPMKTGRLITVIGCGGNRVRQRAKIGKLCYEKSDLLVMTSDNPRWEEPEDIFKVMTSEMDPDPARCVSYADRTEAIRYAVNHGEPGDIILLASKGHETYQEVKGKKIPFNDKKALIAQFNSTQTPQSVTTF